MVTATSRSASGAIRPRCRASSRMARIRPRRGLFRRRLLVPDTLSTRFTDLVGARPSTFRREAVRTTAGLPSCGTKQMTDRSGIEKRRWPARS